MIWVVPTLIMFGKMHILLISENEFTHEIKRDGITSFMYFMRWLLHHHYSSPNKPSIYQTFVWLVVVCRGLWGKRLYSIQLQCVVMGSICQAPGRLRKARKSEGLHSHTATVNQTTEPCCNGISAGTAREQKAMQWLWSSCCINEGLPSDLLINHS